MKVCFMFGHRDCPETVLSDLTQAIIKYYNEYGISIFYVGNRGQFDALAAKAVHIVKQKHPDIELYLLLAYHPAERTPDTYGFDGSYYPPLENVPHPYAIVQGNRYMAENADVIICYVSHLGNTRNLLEYIKKKKPGIPIYNLAEK